MRRILLTLGLLVASFSLCEEVRIRSTSGLDERVGYEGGESAGGLLVVESKDKKSVFCNVFHSPLLNQKHWLVTAKHCLGDETSKYSLIYFDVREGKSKQISLDSKPNQVSIPINPSSKTHYLLDVAVFSVPRSLGLRWESIRRTGNWEVREAVPEKLILWAYVNTPEKPFLFKWTSYSCKAQAAKMPRVQIKWTKKEQEFSDAYRLSYSSQGGSVDEKYGVFLSGCTPPPVVSGALITDEAGVPWGVFHSGIGKKTLWGTWNSGLHLKFKRAWEKKVKQTETDFLKGDFSIRILWGEETLFSSPLNFPKGDSPKESLSRIPVYSVAAHWADVAWVLSGKDRKK